MHSGSSCGVVTTCLVVLAAHEKRLQTSLDSSERKPSAAWLPWNRIEMANAKLDDLPVPK